MKVSSIALLTDFGLSDSYVGQMKGVLLSRAPKTPVVDLCHGVPPQDVVAASFHLRASMEYFPKGTLFVCVVDPGVGSLRRILWGSDGMRQFLAPDNGLLERIHLKECRSLDNRKLFLPEITKTFHGRDIFAPAAAALAGGLSPAKLGPIAGPRRFPAPAVYRSPEELEGTVVLIDRFGNAVTDMVSKFVPKNAAAYLGRKKLGPVRKVYSDVEIGRPLALIGSFGTVELAVREGNFARKFKVRPGAKVRVRAG